MAGWNYNNFGTDEFSKWIMFGLRNQPDKQKEINEIMKQSIESVQKGVDEGVKPQFETEQVKLPDGRTASRFTENAAQLHTLLGGESIVQTLDARAEQKALEKSANRIVSISKAATETAKFAIDNKDKMGPDLTDATLQGVKKLWSAVGLSPNINSTMKWTEALEEIKKTEFAGVNKLYTDLLNAKTPFEKAKALTTLQPVLSEVEQKHKLPSHTFDTVREAIKKTQEELIKPKDNRPYKIGQYLPQEREGNKYVRRVVTGYNTDGTPQTKVVATSPIREGDSGAGAMAKQGAIKEVSKLVAEKYLPLAKDNLSKTLGTDAGSEAGKDLVKGLFTTDQFGMNVNSARLRDSLNPEQQGAYDWIRIRAENYANTLSPATAVDKAITDYHKTHKTSFKNPKPQEKPKDNKSAKGFRYNIQTGQLEPIE